MNGKNSFDKVMDKSRKMFLAEQNIKINSAIMSLLSLSLHQKNEDRDILKCFFHSLKGTGSTLMLDNLAKLGKKYEDYIDSSAGNGCSDTVDKQTLTMLEGLALAYEELEKLDKYLKIAGAETMEQPGSNESEPGKEYSVTFCSGKILAIDDDAAILDMVDGIFSGKGYEVVMSSNPNQAVDILMNDSFDIVLLDIMMPGNDGFNLLNQMRMKKINTPVVFLTAKDDLKSKVDAFQCGAEDYIVKPFKAEELVVRVEHVINKANAFKKDIYTDSLTGAFNRAFFNENFRVAKWRKLSKGEDFSVALVDIDHFREINSLYGFAVGDYILEQFVRQLKSRLESGEQVYRLDGDKFLILFPGIGLKTALLHMEKIKNEIRRKYFYKDSAGPLEISFSGGLYTIDNESDDVMNMLEKLRDTLASSKKSGIGNLTVYQKQEHVKPSNGSLDSRKKILVIDDEGTIIFLVKQRLESMGYEVHTSGDGENGLQKCIQLNPELVIVDLMIPKTDGFEVCRIIRSNPAFAGTKLIVLTSSSRKEYVARCAQIGVDGFIIKPFSLLDIGSRVKKLLGDNPNSMI